MDSMYPSLPLGGMAVLAVLVGLAILAKRAYIGDVRRRRRLRPDERMAEKRRSESEW